MAVALPAAALLLAAGGTAYSAVESHNQAVDTKESAQKQLDAQNALDVERRRRETEIQSQQAALAASRARVGQQKSGYSDRNGTILTGQLGASGAAPTAVRSALGA